MTAKPNSTKSGRLISCIVIAVIVLLVIGGGIAAAIYFIPGLSRQVSTAGNVIVNLTTPLDDSTVPLNSSTAIQVEGLSAQPVTALELWVDGALFASKTIPQSGQKQFFASWGWTPAAAGDHTLFVRALDATKHAFDSNPVHVSASADANSTLAVNYPVKPGDTVQSVAQKTDATPQQIIDLNPQLSPSNPITPGLTISVPLPLPGIPATPISTTLPSAPPPGAGSPITPGGSITVPNPAAPPPPGNPVASPNAFAIPFKLAAAKLIASQPVEQVYCYLSIDGAPASRLPPAPNTFIAPVNGVFDVSAYLHSLSFAPGAKTITLSLDCWGWKGGILVPLGQAKQTINPYQPNGPIVLLGGSFTLNAKILNTFGGSVFDTPPPIPFIYPPHALLDSQDPSVCGLLAAFVCAPAIQNHFLLLKWDWNSPDTFTDYAHPDRKFSVIKNIDGYRVFENDHYFQHQLVNATSNGADSKWTVFSLPPIPLEKLLFAGLGQTRQSFPRCFVVTAFKGALNSEDAPPYCLSGSVPGTQTTTLQPTLFKVSGNRYDQYSTFPTGCGLDVGNFMGAPGGQATQSGFIHHDESCQHHNVALRGLVQFDPQAFEKGPVSSAILKFHLVETSFADNVDGDDPKRLITPLKTVNNLSCATELFLPNADWSTIEDYPNQNQNNMVDGDFLWDLPRNQADWALDVTSAVRSWQTFSVPRTNHGFGIKSWAEGTGAEDNDVCMSTFGNFQLDLTIFPK